MAVGLAGVLLLAGIIGSRLMVKNNSAGNVAAITAEVAKLNNEGDYAGAQKFLLEKIKSDPALELKLALANSYLDEGSVRGKEAEASKKAQEILFELDKNYQGVYLYDLIGYSYEIVNNFDKAMEYYTKSIALDKTSVNTLFSMGHIHWFLGETDQARELYRQAEQLITNNTDKSVQIKVYTGIAVLSSNFSEAEKYLLKAMPLSESRAFKAELYADLANVKLAERDNAGAFEYASKAVTADPSSALAYLAFAKSAMVDKATFAKNWDKVKESLFKAIVLAPKKAEPQHWQGKLEFIAGMTDQAIISYMNALKLLDGDNSLNVNTRKNLRSDINFDIAVAYLLKNDKPRAEVYIKDAFIDNPVKVTYMLQHSEQLKELRVMLKIK